MRTKQKDQKKRRAKTKAKSLVGVYDGENSRKQISAVLTPQTELAELAGIDTDSAPRKKTSAREVEDIVRQIARMHFETEEFIERIVWFKNVNGNEEIHLIDVNRDTIPTGSVMTFYFRESKQFPLPVVIADVTPEEWKKIRSGKIPLPKGWSLENAVEFERDEILA